LPELEDVATDQQWGGLAVTLVIDRVTASRLGIAPATIDNTLWPSAQALAMNFAGPWALRLWADSS
jgi:multidrug efflux pump subunit AcrB